MRFDDKFNNFVCECGSWHFRVVSANCKALECCKCREKKLPKDFVDVCLE
jgi:hypothetical protein